MFKVVVMTDGMMDLETAGTLRELAEDAGAEVSLKKNGIVAVGGDLEALHGAVLDDSRLKGKLSNLYIGDSADGRAGETPTHSAGGRYVAS